MITELIKNEADFKINNGYKIFPDINDRTFWEKAKEDSLLFFEKMYEKFGEIPREHLTASLYRKYATEGNRNLYENIYFKRRCELMTKAFLECMYNDGRFIDDIADLTWMILEESTWCLPAHDETVMKGESLPDFNHHTLDLFAAETASILAFIYQTLGDRLDSFSSIIKRRIKDRVNSVVFDDYINRDDYWWSGFCGGIPNNWCPWINSNVLAAAIVFEDDEERLRKIIYKSVKSVDIYIEKQPDDGGCDEGASYWNQAGLTMLEFLWLLKNITDGQLDFFKEEQVKNTLEYFMKVYTGNGEVVNFSDSGTIPPIYYASVYKFAELTDNEEVKQFAKQLYNDAPLMNIDKLSKRRNVGIVTKVFRMLDNVSYTEKIKNLEGKSNLKSDYYLDSVNVMTSKADFNPLKGLYLAVKGGHNEESHNHNDVGHFIVYKNGGKFLIDIGSMVYSKATFNEDRYTLFTTRSSYHNLPVIDGKEQKFGIEYAAKNVCYKNDGDIVTFSLDIKRAYENYCDIEKWERSFVHDKLNKQIKVTEDFCFSKYLDYELHFVTPYKMELKSDGLRLISDKGETLNMDFDIEKFRISVETIDVTDAYLKSEWGDKLYVISLKAKADKDKLTYILY